MWKYLGAERHLASESNYRPDFRKPTKSGNWQAEVLNILYKKEIETVKSGIKKAEGLQLCPLISIVFFYHIKFSLSVIEHTYLCFFLLV